MKRYIADNWPEYVADIFEGIKWGTMAGILTLVMFYLAELVTHSQATLSIVRDLRGELRSAVGSKEGTEE